MSAYIPPSPEEVRALLKVLELSRGQAGRLANVSGGRVGKWCVSSDASMPYSVLFTVIARQLQLMVSPVNWRQELIERSC